MTLACTLQIHTGRAWHDVAVVALHGPASEGWKARTYSGYTVEWAVTHRGARDAHALCANWPVGLEPLPSPHWPPFLMDLLPQGFGRSELLKRLGQSPLAEAAADWPLLLAGAGCPIGHMRVKEAAAWLQAQTGEVRGYSDDEVAARGDEFTEHLAAHGLFVAGSSGIQGEWPKLLLTRADDGLLYLDHTLPDERAREHYIVKFGRGPDRQLARILQHEAPYMHLARLLGLRVHASLTLRERALFIPRFDRRVQGGRVIRLAQESLATLTGHSGFDSVPSHDQACAALLRHSTQPQADVLEYIRRDVANLALGNKDNHARNTAIQRDSQGRITLSPLYDFAPMVLHPDGVARRIRWEDNDHGQPDWGRVLDRVCQLDHDSTTPTPGPGTRRRPRRPALNREQLRQGLQAMAPVLERIATHGEHLRIDGDLLHHLRPGLLAQAQQLRVLR